MPYINDAEVRAELEDMALVSELESDWIAINNMLEQLEESYYEFQRNPPTEYEDMDEYEDTCAMYENDIATLKGELALIDMQLGR